MNGVGGATVLHVDDRAVRGMPGSWRSSATGVSSASWLSAKSRRSRAAEHLRVTWSAPEPLARSTAASRADAADATADGERGPRGRRRGAFGRAARTLAATYAFACTGACVDGTIVRRRGCPARWRDRLCELAKRLRASGGACAAAWPGRRAGARHLPRGSGMLRPQRRRRRQRRRRPPLASGRTSGPRPVGPRRRVRLGAQGASHALSRARRPRVPRVNVVAWDYNVWTPTHGTRPGGEPGRLLAGELVDPPCAKAARSVGRRRPECDSNYAFPQHRVTAHWIETPPLRPGSLRSLGGMANTTANESFVDELAAAAGADPVEFRLRHLTDPRAIAVIRRAAEAAGWEARPSGPIGAGRTATAAGSACAGRGIAFARYESEYAYVAVVAEVTVDPAAVRCASRRVVVAHDCGLIVNPDGLTNQIEGNVIQGISRALKEEVTLRPDPGDEPGLGDLPHPDLRRGPDDRGRADQSAGGTATGARANPRSAR